jgi:hypothetical protein
MKHKHYNEIIAWAEGKEIEVKLPSGTWMDAPCPNWNPDTPYRVRDPYRELKDAHETGKIIQIINDYGWEDIRLNKPFWNEPVENYRIKPEEPKQQLANNQNEQASEPMFAKSKVGDKVFSLQYGEGTIKSFDCHDHTVIEVDFKRKVTQYYDNNGFPKYYGVAVQDLYWNKPQIIAPKK